MSDADVIVLGAGVIGAAVAFELSAAGRRVRVIDRRGPGRGATQASAGVLSPYIEGHDAGPLSALGHRSLDLYDAFVDRVSQASGRAIVYQRNGSLEVARDDAHAEQLRASAVRLASRGIEARWLDADAVAVAEPAVARTVIGGLLIDLHAVVGASDLTQALVDAATRQGAIFEYGTRALGVEPAAGDGGDQDSALAVLTNAGRWSAHHIVICAGSWSNEIAVPGIDACPFRPVRGQLVALRTPQPLLRHVVWGNDGYLVPWPDGTTLVGATMEDVGFDERATVHGVAGLLDAARRLVPGLDEAAFEGVRVGLRPAGPDHLPLIGPSSRWSRLFYAAGHFRNGVLLAPLTAMLVRDLVEGKTADPAFDLLRPSRAGV